MIKSTITTKRIPSKSGVEVSARREFGDGMVAIAALHDFHSDSESEAHVSSLEAEIDRMISNYTHLNK